MNFPDMRTVFLSYIICSVICALVILYLWMQHRRRTDAVHFWLACYILNFFFALMIILRGVIPVFFSIIVGNALAAGVILCLCIGMERYSGIRSKQYQSYLFIALFILIHAYFTYVNPSYLGRKINVSAIFLVICLQCVWRLLRRADAEVRQAVKLFVANLAVFCLVSLVRIYVDVALSEGIDYFRSSAYDTAVVLVYQMLTIASTFIIYMMVNERLFSELERDAANRRHIEKELRKSEERYRLLADNVTDVIWTIDFDGRFTYVSSSVEKLLGYTVAEIVNESILDTLTPSSVFRAKEGFVQVAQAMRTGETDWSFRDEFEQFCKNGEIIWTETTVSGLRNSSGDLIGVLGVTRDVSNRKRADVIMQARLELLEYSTSHTLPEVLQRTLDLVEELTGSKAGFYHFVEDDQKTLSMQVWSTRTIEEFCKPEGYSIHYPVEKAGVWSECIYAGKPVIHNDYASLPNRKGLPPGHLPVIRELVVPIFRSGRIVSVLGVCNRTGDYTEKDVNLVAFFADVAWEVVERKRAEAALKESEKRYALTLDAVKDGLWDWHVPSGTAFFSPMYYDLLGYEDREFVASYAVWRSKVHPDDLEQVEKELQKSIESGQSINIEFRIKMKSGRFRWVASRGKVVEWDADGKALRIVGTMNDIGERKQMERYRGLTSEVLQILNEADSFKQSIHDIIAAVKKATGYDAVGVRLQSGEDYPYFDQSGFDDEFLLSENSVTARDHDGCICRAADGGVVMECTCGLVLSGKTDPADPLFTKAGSFWTNNLHLLTRLSADEDPRYRPRNKCIHYGYASLALIPIRTRQKIIGLLQINDRRKDQFSPAGLTALESIASHVGEAFMRRQSEAALQESESKYRLLVDQSSDLIWSLNADGVFTYISPSWERVTGYDPASLVNTAFQPLVHPDDLAACMEYLLSMIEKRITTTSAEYRVRHADGAWHWHSANATPIAGPDGRFTSMVGISRDITERKEAEEALRAEKEKALEASRAKSEFLSIMSHEIRTPLNAIIGMSELLGETALDDDQQIYVKTFRNAGESLLSIINNILDYSKIEAGKVESEKAEFDLMETVEKISAVLALQAHKKHVELIVYIPSNVPSFLIGDQKHLRQVLMNLIGNAVKFTEEGEVIVRLEKVGGSRTSRTCEIKFVIEDTGIGIDADKLSVIFELFSQADSSVTRKFGGTGLGLAISRKLVELMGGRIFVESQPGRGSRFYFTLSFEVQKEEGGKKHDTAIDLKGMRVLVVDDNATNRLIVNRMLSPWGAAVTEVYDARDAIKEMRKRIRSGESPYDLIIIDRHMPGMNGFELAEFVSGDPRLKASKMIIMTSDSFSIDTAGIQKFGISGYLVKPVKKSDLKESIVRALQLNLAGKEVSKASSSAVDLRPLKILLVEDAENNRVLIRSYLKKTPFVVEEAEDGLVALEKFKAGAYDVVLMDVQMPGMDGFTATKEIRKWEKEHALRPTPVLALTAHVFKDDIDRSLESGCNAHLTKPIKKETLLKAILTYAPEGEEAPVETFTVHVDPDLSDLIPSFMENTRKDIDTIDRALREKDMATVRRIGHSMKSYGSGYGFEYIGKAGRAVESAAMDDDYSGVEEILTDLKNYLDKVRVDYDG